MYWPQPDGNYEHGEVYPHAVAMQSNAGWYAGSIYWDEQMQGWYPHDRHTMYVSTEEEAQKLANKFNEESHAISTH